MRTGCTIEGEEACLLVSDVDASYHQAIQDLGFTQVGDGFVRRLPATSPQLDGFCANFTRDAEQLIGQNAGTYPVPWESALEAFQRIVDGHGIDWFLAGSGALAVRGLRVMPRDLDIVTDDAGAQRLGALLIDYLVEPVVLVRDWFCRWWGRAFIGARIEWVGGVDERGDTPHASDFGPTAAGRLEAVVWHGYTIRVPPLDLQRDVSERRGLTGRVVEIDRVLRGRGPRVTQDLASSQD